MANNNKEKIKEVNNKIRDLINYVQIMSDEELKSGEGRKIEEDTAEDLKNKLRELAQKVGKL